MKKPTINTLNYIIAVPLIVMSYHIYNFYETEPVLVRIALALSFDLMVVVCFYLLKDELIAKRKQARQATWGVLILLIAFQLYVNVWAYWDLHWFRAFLSGGIFPLTVAMVSYIGMLREQEHEKKEEKAQAKAEVQSKIAELQSPTNVKLIAAEQPWKNELVDKTDVIKAFADSPETETMEVFRGARNWKSVKRWWKKLQAGETP
jgi:hypothetical protein